MNTVIRVYCTVYGKRPHKSSEATTVAQNLTALYIAISPKYLRKYSTHSTCRKLSFTGRVIMLALTDYCIGVQGATAVSGRQAAPLALSSSLPAGRQAAACRARERRQRACGCPQRCRIPFVHRYFLSAIKPGGATAFAPPQGNHFCRHLLFTVKIPSEISDRLKDDRINR